MDSEIIDVFSSNDNVFVTPRGRLIEIFISGVIKSPSEYIKEYHLLRNASPLDDVKIYINSGGGDLAAALQFMRVMGECQAEITCSVEGECMSAATMIFLCGDAYEITPHSLFMFHNYSGGIIGKGGEMYDQALFEREWSTKLLKDVYDEFLTTDEIEQLLENKNFWMHSDEVDLRLRLRSEAFEKRNNELQT